jgi:fatty-acyl-CoA synthase/long-chain acyl-CoA synthetase
MQLKHSPICSNVPGMLRKMAIMRVYNAVLADAGLSARVLSVVEHKKRGLVACLDPAARGEEAAVTRVLGEFTRPWEWADDAVKLTSKED